MNIGIRWLASRRNRVSVSSGVRLSSNVAEERITTNEL
jgi:hypothetical protein